MGKVLFKCNSISYTKRCKNLTKFDKKNEPNHALKAYLFYSLLYGVFIPLLTPIITVFTIFSTKPKKDKINFTNITLKNINTMNKKSPKIRNKKKFVFNYTIAEIKKQNLFFAVTYCEKESPETYTENLRWSEIFKPQPCSIEVKNMVVIKNGVQIFKLYQKNSKKLLNILDMYNSTGLIYNEIKPVSAPTEKEIIFCISLYFGIPQSFSRCDILFKTYLKEIAEKRRYFDKIKNPKEKEVFQTFFNRRIPKLEISKELTNHTKKGVYLIDSNLKNLVAEIMKDYEKGLLQVIQYQKPLTKRQIIKKANTKLKERGIDIKIPLRKQSKREIVNSWRKRKEEINSKINDLADKRDKRTPNTE